MASGMGSSVESDVVVASGELEPQYRSSTAHGKQLATEVSRMKVGWLVGWFVAGFLVCVNGIVSMRMWLFYPTRFMC